MESRQFGDKDVKGAATFGIGAGSKRPAMNASGETTTENLISVAIITDMSTTSTAEDENSYVPNTLEGQITLSNTEFLPEHRNVNSTAYKSLVKELEMEIKKLVAKDSDIVYVKIIGLK